MSTALIKPEAEASLVDKLNAPLPPEAVMAHPTKSYLSSIKTIYQVERLNEVFGIGGWNAKSEIIEQNPSDGKIPGMIILRVTLKVPAYGIEMEQYGGNDNADRGDAYKGAFTDALSKICGYLGIGMAIYKGDGPTKINPRGSKAASDAVRDRKLADIGARKAAEQAVPLPAQEDSPFTYQDEPPSELELTLAESIKLAETNRPKKKPGAGKIEMLQSFGELKKRYKGIGMEQAYYAILGQHGVCHSNEFPDDANGMSQARMCYKAMTLDCADEEAYSAREKNKQ
jgi:hypothetical protein